MNMDFGFINNEEVYKQRADLITIYYKAEMGL